MSEDRYIPPLRLFSEAEAKRMMDMMLGVPKYETPQMVRARYELPKSHVKVVSKIPRFKSADIDDDYNKLLTEHGITAGAELVVNDGLKSILHGFVIELIKRGLVVCEIKDNVYNPKTYSIELSAIVSVPPITQRRLDIEPELL